MKKLINYLAFLFISINMFSQSDTLYLQKNKKVACKIVEINDSEIKYKAAVSMDGPLYIIDKSNVLKYTLSNGVTELVIPDELSLENEHKQILDNRRVIKINPFSPAFSHISFGYERVIKVGMNLDVQAGYINSEISPQIANVFNGGTFGNLHNSGAYIKPGVKFFLGEDFSVKGLKYAHPLKGRYIKLDFAISYINFQNLSNVYYGSTPNNNNTTYPYNNYTYTTQTVYSNLNTIAYGGFVNYGRQFILGNILTLEYYIGVGFTGQSQSYSNPDFFKNPFGSSAYQTSYGNFNENNFTSNYYGFVRVPSVGLSFTSGFRIGYIIPSKNQNKRMPLKN